MAIFNEMLGGGINAKDCTATSSDILSGKTAAVGKEIITGSMTNNGNVNGTLTQQGQSFSIPKGYHDGDGKVEVQISGLIADVIKQNAVVGGITGTLALGVITGSTTQSRKDSFTIQHSLGRVPTVAILMPREYGSSKTGLLWTYIVKVGDTQFECQYSRGSSGTVTSDQFQVGADYCTSTLTATSVTFARAKGFNTNQYFNQTYDYFIG